MTTVAKSAPPVILSLYQQGGKSSSVFIRLAGFSGKHNISSHFCLLIKHKNYTIAGAAAVVLGAYGAHKGQWPEPNDSKRDPRQIFEVANKYHFYNSLALMAVPLVKRPWLTGSLMVTGIILFSGTCYYSSITGDQKFNRLAPL